MFKKRISTKQPESIFKSLVNFEEPVGFSREVFAKTGSLGSYGVSKGVQDKKLMQNDYFYKIDECHTSLYENKQSTMEAFNEHLVSCLIESTGFNYNVKYEICFNSDPYFQEMLKDFRNVSELNACRSKNFLTKTGGEFKSFKYLLKGFLKANNINESIFSNFILDSNNSIEKKITLLAEVFVFYGFRLSTAKKYLKLMFYYDSFVLNIDRHLGNFGIIRIKKGKYILAPLFDFGRSFLWGLKDIKNYTFIWKTLKNSVEILPFKDKSLKMREFFKDEIAQKLDITGLLNKIDERTYNSFPFNVMLHCIYDMLDTKIKKKFFIFKLTSWSKQNNIQIDFLDVVKQSEKEKK